MDDILNSYLEEVLSHLGACIQQRIKSDDSIIMDHVQDAYHAAKKAQIVATQRPHCHAAGTKIGKHIDECAICGHDIRNEIHAGQR